MGMHIVNAQVKTISGTVTSSEDGSSIPGVSVVVKGTTIGTTTNIDGNYQMQVPDDAAVVVFSFVGMKAIEVPITGSTVNATLEPDYIGVEEVMVLGYASHRKSEMTGSSVQLSGDELADIPVASIDKALQGRVAGVEISSASGTPGSVANIRIRGVSSITAGNNPLYVVDGVPIVNEDISSSSASSSFSTLAAIDPNNIESITVLKDATATAAYGARGANGVIVITTKSGKKGKASINVSATYGISNDAIDGPKVLTAAQAEELFIEQIMNTFGVGTVEDAKKHYFYTTWNGGKYVKWNEDGRPEGNWAKVITNKNAPMKEFNVSATGGENAVSYYTSLSYLDQEATVIGSTYERISGALNLNVDLSKSFKFNTKNTVSYSKQDGLLENSAYFSSPRTIKYFMPATSLPYNEDGSIKLDNPGSLPNPLWIAQEDLNLSKYTRILSNNSITWDTPIDNLVFSTRATIDYHVYNYQQYQNPVSGDGDGATRGAAWHTFRNRANYVIQNRLDYELLLGEKHSFSMTALQEYQVNKLYYLSADGENFSDVGLTYLNSAGKPTGANSWFTDWHIASYLGMVHYSFDEARFVADFSYRREGSSRFAASKRWGNFWAVGAAWNLTREDFISNVDFINTLKLRTSYGVSGNANIDLNQFDPLLNYNSDYNGEGASYPGNFGNNDLSWETVNNLDVGIDFGFLNSRINGSFGYYYRETKDMLLEVPLSLTTGFDEQTRNIGRMMNKGFEAELSIDVIRSKDFNINIGGNLGTNKNEVLELAKDLNGDEVNITSTIDRVETGHPVYGWYMPTWAGVNPETGQEEWYIDINENEDKTTNFNSAKQVWQGGSAIPKITAGANIHVDFKGFFVDASAYFAGGHKVYEGWHRYTNSLGLYGSYVFQSMDVVLDRWKEPGDKARYGKSYFGTKPWQRHSKFLYDGDYLRLKDVTIGYNFQKSIVDKIGLAGLKVFVKGTNLLTWVKDDNLKYDPEVGTDGESGLETPAVRSYIMGINVKF